MKTSLRVVAGTTEYRKGGPHQCVLSLTTGCFPAQSRAHSLPFPWHYFHRYRCCFAVANFQHTKEPRSSTIVCTRQAMGVGLKRQESTTTTAMRATSELIRPDLRPDALGDGRGRDVRRGGSVSVQGQKLS